MKRKNSIRSFCVMVLAPMVILLTFGWASAQPVAPSKPIKIGALLPMTGAFAAFGPCFKAGIELRLDEAGWKVAGRPIELIVEDDATSDSTVGLDKTKKMVESDKINIMIGPLHSGIRLAVEPYMEEKKIPNITLSRHLTRSAKEGGWTFLQAGTLREFSRPMGWWAYEKGFRTASTLASDFVAGHQYINGAIEGFKEKGGQVIQQQLPPMPTADYAPYVSAIKQADVVINWLGSEVDTLGFLTIFYELGLHRKMKMITLIADDVFREEQMPSFGDKILGMTGSVKYNWRLDTPPNKKFVKDIEAKTGKKPYSHHNGGYDAACVAISALEATGGDTAPDRLRKAILGLKIMTPAGPLSFTSNGIGVRNLYIVEIQKTAGQYGWVPIKTYAEFRTK